MFLLVATSTMFAQSNSVYSPNSVYNVSTGVTMYEKFNQRSASPELRLNDKGNPISGYVTDKYSHGCPLHRGYYQKGRLVFYANYHPNGQVEREFKIIDEEKSKMYIYYKGGEIKSEIVYLNNAALKWKDYYENGKVAFYEEFDKSLEYHILKIEYFTNGNEESRLELINKRDKVFLQQYYFFTGELKAEGKLRFSKMTYDYEKVGKWKWYREDGREIEEPFNLTGGL